MIFDHVMIFLSLDPGMYLTYCKPCSLRCAGDTAMAGSRKFRAAALVAELWKVLEGPESHGCKARVTRMSGKSARWRLESVSISEPPSQLYWHLTLMMQQEKTTSETRKNETKNRTIIRKLKIFNPASIYWVTTVCQTQIEPCGLDVGL